MYYEVVRVSKNVGKDYLIVIWIELVREYLNNGF